MNIFEALEAGNGKATLPWCATIDFVFETPDKKMVWESCSKTSIEVARSDLKRNEWQPYVLRETKKYKEVFENVKCLINSLGGIDLSIRAGNDTDRLNKIAGKVTTMILEWQE